jgi:long-chain fatty acid transport protein
LGLNASCSYKFDLGNGYRVRAIAGLISTDVSVKRTNETVLAPPPGLIIATNTYDAESDRGYGYRVGAAFEIPKYALRAQVIYDSKIDLDFTGTQTLPGHPFSGSAITASLELPQSVAARIQSGINDTTLVYAGVRWTEWSVIDQLDIIGGTSGVGGVNTLPFGYDNGWTVDVGVQKKLSKDLGGSLGVTWNSGIGNGFTDTWGFSAGLSYDLDDNWRISLGGSATLLTSSTESNGPASTGATSNYTQGDDWAYAAGLRLQYAID